MPVDVEHHRHERVVAAGAHQVHHALLAEAGPGLGESGVAHALRFMQFAAEIVHRGLLARHALGAPPLRDGLGDARIEPRLHRHPVVREPLVLRGPVARGDEDREFVQPRRQRTAEADVLADLLRAVGQLGGCAGCALNGPRTSRAAPRRWPGAPCAAPPSGRIPRALQIVFRSRVDSFRPVEGVARHGAGRRGPCPRPRAPRPTRTDSSPAPRRTWTTVHGRG